MKITIIQDLQGLILYIRDYVNYCNQQLPKDSLKIELKNIFPRLTDRYENAGLVKGDYFHQDLWVARKIFTANTSEHWDIGSRIDGFITHLLTFRDVNVIDIRPLKSETSGLTFYQGDITKLPFPDNSIESLSCLHTVEHIGLGRYGDPLDPAGCFKGMNELQRVLSPKGKLYFSVPIGRECVQFNAHRIFDPLTIIESFNALDLIEFVAINEEGNLVEPAQLDDFRDVNYSCGVFVFSKPSL
jgi:SAM-dependent methyltransferase